MNEYVGIAVSAVLAAGIAAVFTVLVGASIVSTVLYLRAEEARAETEIESTCLTCSNNFTARSCSPILLSTLPIWWLIPGGRSSMDSQ